MTNIASNEDSGLDFTGKWINKTYCHVKFRYNEDDAKDVVIDYIFDHYDLTFLRDVLTEFLDSQPKA